VYCDESGTGGQRYYGFGSLWMPWQRRGDFQRRWREATAGARYGPSEVKWQKVKGPTVETYASVVNMFLDTNWLNFHCMLVEKAWVDRELHGGDLDLARRKHYTQFLANKVRRCVRAQPHRQTEVRVYADQPFGGSRYAKAHEAAEAVGNNMLAQALNDIRPIERVLCVDSKQHAGIQVCDVLLGAVMDAFNRGSKNQAKATIRKQIAAHLGWEDLDADTKPHERKFNIWYMCDPREPRVVQTRPVRLAKPLPPIRHYRR